MLTLSFIVIKISTCKKQFLLIFLSNIFWVNIHLIFKNHIARNVKKKKIKSYYIVFNLVQTPHFMTHIIRIIHNTKEYISIVDLIIFYFSHWIPNYLIFTFSIGCILSLSNSSERYFTLSKRIVRKSIQRIALLYIVRK